MPGPYRVVQPLGRDVAEQSSTISYHLTAAEAFASIEAFAMRAVQTGAPSDAVELLVLDADGRRVARPAH